MENYLVIWIYLSIVVESVLCKLTGKHRDSAGSVGWCEDDSLIAISRIISIIIIFTVILLITLIVIRLVKIIKRKLDKKLKSE